MNFSSVSPTYIPFPAENVGMGKVYRSPMPRSSELTRFKEETKINKIVQLCFDQEFGFYGKSDVLRKYKEMEFEVIKFPIEDFKVPESKEETMKIVDQILESLKRGENVLIHCVGGNGRTGLLLACIARKVFGMSGGEAIKWVRQYVPGAVEKAPQEEFVATCLEGSKVGTESPLLQISPPSREHTEPRRVSSQPKRAMRSEDQPKQEHVVITVSGGYSGSPTAVYHPMEDEDQGCFAWFKKYCCC